MTVGTGVQVGAGGGVVRADPVHRYVQRIAERSRGGHSDPQSGERARPQSDDNGVELAEPVSRVFERGGDQRHELFGVGEGVGDPLLRQQFDGPRFCAGSPLRLDVMRAQQGDHTGGHGRCRGVDGEQ